MGYKAVAPCVWKCKLRCPNSSGLPASLSFSPKRKGRKIKKRRKRERREGIYFFSSFLFPFIFCFDLVSSSHSQDQKKDLLLVENNSRYYTDVDIL